MNRLLHAVFLRLIARPCRGCDCTEPHSHHLTRFGLRHYARAAA